MTENRYFEDNLKDYHQYTHNKHEKNDFFFFFNKRTINPSVNVKIKNVKSKPFTLTKFDLLRSELSLENFVKGKVYSNCNLIELFLFKSLLQKFKFIFTIFPF